MPAEGAEDAPRRCEYYDGEGWVGLYQQFVRKVMTKLIFSCTSHATITLSTSFPCRSVRTHHHGSQRYGKFHGTSMSNTRACPFLPRSSNWDTAITFPRLYNCRSVHASHGPLPYARRWPCEPLQLSHQIFMFIEYVEYGTI